MWQRASAARIDNGTCILPHSKVCGAPVQKVSRLSDDVNPCTRQQCGHAHGSGAQHKPNSALMHLCWSVFAHSRCARVSTVSMLSRERASSLHWHVHGGINMGHILEAVVTSR